MSNRTNRLRMILLAFAFVTTAVTSPLPAAASADSVCRRAIESGLTTWLATTMKARQRCVRGVIDGLPVVADGCITGVADDELQQALEAADATLRERLAARCAGTDWGLLSYPGPCGETTDPFDTDSMVDCMEMVGGNAVTELLEVWYPDSVSSARGAAADCMRSIPKRALAMVLAELRARLRCLFQDEAEDFSTGVDCRGQQVPYGQGTHDARLDTLVRRAQRIWLAGMPDSCAEADFAELGYGVGCSQPVSGSGLISFQSCVFDAHRRKIPVLLDLAFPSDPVCGNGIPQDGEECDNGALNSDTMADACREDCRLAVCGDGTTDAGNHEQCDDGNGAELDGCTPSCVLEVCGDGIANGSPHEACDDGNRNQNDTCTNSCTAAVCGDGLVCSNASCTSGPAGGPELCDAGAANASDGACHPDCSGFSRTCTMTIGVTNNVNLGAITYELDYRTASGEVSGSGANVKCSSLITGGLASFFDNETRRIVTESVILAVGFQGPVAMARCTFATNDQQLSGTAFAFHIVNASDPNFDPVVPTVAVTSLVCP